MRNIVVVFLSVLVALGITLGSSFALAEEGGHENTSGEFKVTVSSIPRFPIMGEEAELSVTISHDGTPVEGLAVTLLLTQAEAGHGDDHGEAVVDDHDDAEADGHDDAEADGHDDAEADGHDDAEAADTESGEIVAVEKMAGVYVANYTFEQEGKYLGTVQIGENQTDFTVAVRAKPVAWSFLAGLGGVSIFVAGMVFIIKLVRKDW